MEEFWILILVSFFATNSLDIAESVQLDEKPLKIIDEIFGEGWWDNGKSEEWHKLTLEHNLHHQIDRQNTQIGQFEPNSTDQNPPLTEPDHSGQIEPNSTDQNPRLTDSYHSKEISSNENIAENERKRKIVHKFIAIKDEFKQKGKYSDKERLQIEEKIARHLKVSRTKIYKWKNEFGLNRRNPKNERKNLIEKFDQMKAELKRDGLKNYYCHELDETVAKELGLSVGTIYKWKRELGQTAPNHKSPQHKYTHSEQNELMKCYYEIKDQNPKIRDADIAKRLKVEIRTLYRWKKQFELHQFHLNSVYGHSAVVNAAENSNSRI